MITWIKNNLMLFIGMVLIGIVLWRVMDNALYSLFAGLLGVGKLKEVIADSRSQAKAHAGLTAASKKKAQEKQNEANEIHDEIINIAEDITDPKTLPDSKRKRTDIKFG